MIYKKVLFILIKIVFHLSLTPSLPQKARIGYLNAPLTIEFVYFVLTVAEIGPLMSPLEVVV